MDYVEDDPAAWESAALVAAKKEGGGVFTRKNVGRCALAGAGFLADAYDLFVINIGTAACASVGAEPPRRA